MLCNNFQPVVFLCLPKMELKLAHKLGSAGPCWAMITCNLSKEYPHHLLITERPTGAQQQPVRGTHEKELHERGLMPTRRSPESL